MTEVKPKYPNEAPLVTEDFQDNLGSYPDPSELPKVKFLEIKDNSIKVMPLTSVVPVKSNSFIPPPRIFSS